MVSIRHYPQHLHAWVSTVEELVNFQVAFVVTVWTTVISAATDKNKLK